MQADPERQDHRGGAEAEHAPVLPRPSKLDRETCECRGPFTTGCQGIRLAGVTRCLTALACGAWLAVAGSLPLLHVHVDAGHEHRAHRHGPAMHGHAPHGVGAPDAAGREERRLGPCDPGDHAVSLSAVRATATTGAPVFVAPALTTTLFALDAEAPAAAPRDVRAHSPPRLSDGPLRAPPASRPA
jgi:hypothetical protein